MKIQTEAKNVLNSLNLRIANVKTYEITNLV